MTTYEYIVLYFSFFKSVLHVHFLLIDLASDFEHNLPFVPFD
jgi:hypothetical protein